MPRVPELSATRAVEPTLADSLCAAGRAPFLAAQDPSVPTILQTLGFEQVGPGRYLHADTSWIQEDQDRFVRGLGERRFERIPQPFAQYANTPYSEKSHAGYAIAALANKFTRDSSKLRGELLRAGFAPVHRDFYGHPDGSWVAIIDKVPQAGVNTTPLSGWLKVESVAPAAPIACPYKGSNAPSSWEEWVAHIAVAKLPWVGVRGGGSFGTQISEGFDGKNYQGVTAAENVRILEFLGFKAGAEGGATVWRHPDGSAITQHGDTFNDLTFDGVAFARFPFEASRHWAHSLRPRTEKWRAWCQDPQANPAPQNTLTGS